MSKTVSSSSESVIKGAALIVIGKCRCGEPAVLRMRVLLSPTKATRSRKVCLKCSNIPRTSSYKVRKEKMADTKSKAEVTMDWQQVILNGGPPCFFIEGPQFCGRAERWQGHGNPAFHDYVSLQTFLATAQSTIAIS